MNDDARLQFALKSDASEDGGGDGAQREAPKNFGEAFRQLGDIFRTVLGPLIEFDAEEMQYRVWRSKGVATRYAEVLLTWAHFFAGTLLYLMGLWLIAFVFMVLIVSTIELTTLYVNGDLHRALIDAR